ncbi:hypothetical protein G6L37_03000 [Agrobacterium rubi]|nr:hypothetical protein [Agrobacterium rubi]NTF24346.1 hypothetical protein [Agrobacterium rubi]
MARIQDFIMRIARLLRTNRNSGGNVSVAPGEPSVMRLNHDDELTSWFRGKMCCPDCGEKEFLPGPRGGLSQNMSCVGCGSEFNLASYDGDVFLASRIDRTGVHSGVVVRMREESATRILH